MDQVKDIGRLLDSVFAHLVLIRAALDAIFIAALLSGITISECASGFRSFWPEPLRLRVPFCAWSCLLSCTLSDATDRQ